MKLTRRKTLALIGGGSILAAGGIGTYAVTRTPKSAYLPWQLAGTYEDPRMRALSYAILAPNPHNRQPWKVDLAQANTVTLYVDRDRLLPHTDPFNRQIVIGLGCFLELMVMAAAQDGFGVSIDLFPDGASSDALDDRIVAQCTFQPGGGAPDPLFAHVMNRRSLKEPFDTSRPVDPSVLDAIKAAAQYSDFGGSVEAQNIAFWRDLTHEALRIEIATPHTYKESVDLFRIGRREVDANPDGIDFSGPMFEAMALTGMFTREIALDRDSAAYREGEKAVYANTDTAMGHIWQTTPGNTRQDQIAAGRDWLRINLVTASLGLGVQPLSQALQEYPEMDALYRQTHETLAPEGQTVQMLARIGYGDDIAHSPRWPVTDKIMDA